MILPAHMVAAAHVVTKVFQLILGKNFLRQDGFFQVLEEVAPNYLLAGVKCSPKRPSAT